MLTAAPPRWRDRLTHLPRDARDTLFLLAVIAWIVLPQVARLPGWCSALVATVLVWRGWLAWTSQPLPGRGWRLALLMLALAATAITHRTLLGRDAGVTLIVALLALKTLELRARRDAFVIFFLGFFTMLTNFFFSQSLLTAAAMLVALLGLLTALVNAHMPVGRPPLAQAARIAGGMAVLGAPLMAVMFMLFPRLAPLWGIPADAMSGRTGLSASMRVGAIASLALDESIAMRIRFDGAPPPPQDLYFRGPVLAAFDGREWRPLPGRAAPPFAVRSALEVRGPAVRYEVTLEPSNRPWVMLLEATAVAPQLAGIETAMTPDLTWLADRPLTDLTRYRAESHPQFRLGAGASGRARLEDELRLPPGFNPRTLQLALDLRRDPRLASADAATLVAAVLERLRSGGYTYTLDPGPSGEHSADEFWFDHKEGFCEHIASAFVVLMRALDVPARIVTGYQGGQLNPIDGYWTVRQSDAHAWAEVWQPGRGWIRVDPTAAVMPARIGASRRLAPPAGALTTAVGTLSPDLAQRLRQGWDALNNLWNQRVLNYTQSRQLDLLRRLGFTSPRWEDLGLLLIGIGVAASLAGAGWAAWERHRQDPWLRLLGRARRGLAVAGIDSPPQAPPRALAGALAEQRPDLPQREALQAWLLRLEAARYAADTPARRRAQLATLRREFRQLPWPARSPAAPLADHRTPPTVRTTA